MVERKGISYLRCGLDVLTGLFTLWLFGLLVLGVWCSALKSTNAQSAGMPINSSSSQSETILPGQIIDKVQCLDDLAQSYALYLPSNYSKDRAWPILYAFDPAARGKQPVARYREAAEKYGWIVVGSNNSRNGPIQQSFLAWSALWKDSHGRFSIDPRRTYITGFSGGARMAILFAIRCGDCVAGVIASSAGFPEGIAPSRTMSFALFGTAGQEDFNLPEIKSLEDTLTKSAIAHRVEVFPGRHEWPSPSLAMEGIEWLELQAMRRGARLRDNELIEHMFPK